MQLIQAVSLRPSIMRMQGTLVIHVRDAATRRVLRTIHKRNTITFDAGDIVRGLLAQRTPPTDPAPVEYSLGSMRFGTSTTVPTRFDTDLIAEVPAVRQELTDVKKVNGIQGEMSLQASLGTADANGSVLTEAGLFTRSTAWNSAVGGTLLMFARQVHASITKSSSISLDYNWTLQFTTV
jgi:hypothetical protein